MAQNYGGPMNLEDEFCDILKKARFGQGQGLAALAELTQIEPSDLESLEKGQRLPTKAEIQHICQALHLRLHSLVAITPDRCVEFLPHLHLPAFFCKNRRDRGPSRPTPKN